MTEQRKLWNKKDFILIGAVLCLALFIFIIYRSSGADGNLECHIIMDGKLLRTVSLADDQIFALEQIPDVVFEVRNHAVAFIASDCPDKICVNNGFLGHSGQTAVCLPNRTVIRIMANRNLQSPGEPDTIAY